MTLGNPKPHQCSTSVHVAVGRRKGGKIQTIRMDCSRQFGEGFNSLYSTVRGGGLSWCVLLFWEPPLFKILKTEQGYSVRNKVKGIRICPSGPKLGTPGFQHLSN